MSSSPTKRYDICAGRPYTTKDGEEKKQWIKVGKLSEWSEGGPSIELFATPTGAWFDGKLSCFDQEGEKAGGQGKPASGRPNRSASPDPSDDPPF